jgi:hypothetical protein
MVPKVNRQNIQVSVINPVYKTVKGQEKFVKEVFLKVWMDKNDINAYGEYVGSKGQIVKNRTRIHNKSTGGFSIIGHSLKEMEEVLQLQKIGYKTN